MRRYLLFFYLSFVFVSMGAQVIPMPQSMKTGSESLTLNDETSICYASQTLLPAAEYLQAQLKNCIAIDALMSSGKKGTVRLAIKKQKTSGAYTLSITSEGIDIKGSDYPGVVNGITTLVQMLLLQGTTLQAVSISDAPCYQWRGFHLDCSRHFFTRDEVERIIDLMALYKINRFHWHLTDDQGWRIEIKKYPLLTERGAWRKYNNQDSICVKRAKTEDNIDLLIPNDRFKVVDGDTLYGGYYTQDDIRHVVAYARQRGIEIMPEIDMPGHFLSAIDNYEGLSCFPQTGWGTFFTTPLCPGKDRMIEFCKDVWREVASLFPYEYVHIGGDEVRKDTWEKCPDCQKRMKDEGLKDEKELQSWFIHQMEAYLKSLNKKMMGWDEILEGGLSKTASVTWWRTWSPDVPDQITAQGNRIIYCPVAPFYFSQPSQPHSLRSIYEYSLHTDKMDDRQRNLVMGVQGCLWAEGVPTIERAEYLFFPRMLSLSELAWTQPDRKNYDDFSQRVVAHYPLLHKLGVNYRTPDAQGFFGTNAFIRESDINITCSDPIATLRYTTDGTAPRQDSPVLGKLKIDQTTYLNIRPFLPDGRCGEVTHIKYVKQGYLEAVNPAKPVETGLTAAWYDYDGEACSEITKAKFNGTYHVSDCVIPDACKGNIGLVISGYLQVPADGIYTFALMSDDGSWLKIDGNMVVDNDRPQSPHEEIAQQALKAGLHHLELRYFDHNGGLLRLYVNDDQGRRLSPADIYRR